MVYMAFGACTKSGFVFSFTLFPFDAAGRTRLRFLYPSEPVNLTLTLPELNIQPQAVYMRILAVHRKCVYVVSCVPNLEQSAKF